MSGQQVVLTSDLESSARVDLNDFQGCILGDTGRATDGMIEAVVKNRFPDLLADPVRMWRLGAG